MVIKSISMPDGVYLYIYFNNKNGFEINLYRWLMNVRRLIEIYMNAEIASDTKITGYIHVKITCELIRLNI